MWFFERKFNANRCVYLGVAARNWKVRTFCTLCGGPLQLANYSPFSTIIYFSLSSSPRLDRLEANTICIHFWRKSINKLVFCACAVGAHARCRWLLTRIFKKINFLCKHTFNKKRNQAVGGRVSCAGGFVALWKVYTSALNCNFFSQLVSLTNERSNIWKKKKQWFRNWMKIDIWQLAEWTRAES